MSDPDDACCLPGDFTITPLPTGFLIGRALQPIGPGPWWEFVRIVPIASVALHEVRQLARETGSRAWLHQRGTRYVAIPLDGSPFDLDQ
jgi:hypothetical protein